MNKPSTTPVAYTLQHDEGLMVAEDVLHFCDTGSIFLAVDALPSDPVERLFGGSSYLEVDFDL